MLQFKDKILVSPGAPWYSSWFNEDLYDEIYTHRSEAEAESAVDLLNTLVCPYSANLFHSFILDIGCGNCRHLPYLRRISRNIIGLDLSYRQLKNGKKYLARAENKISQNLIRSDMKFLPVKNNSLGLITNFFTSFGYFKCDSEHQETLNNWAASLQEKGLMFIDLFNRNFVLDSLKPYSGSTVNGYTIEQHRKVSSDQKRVEKRISIYSGSENKTFNESVRLFSLEELTNMLLVAGLKVIEIKGSYLGAEYRDTSERLIILAQKA